MRLQQVCNALAAGADADDAFVARPPAGGVHLSARQEIRAAAAASAAEGGHHNKGRDHWHPRLGAWLGMPLDWRHDLSP
jgi:anti-sigma factor RsiW